MNVVTTFGYVVARSARNRVVTQVKRLKQPRYLIATLFGLAYWWLYIGRNVAGARSMGRLSADNARPAAAGFVVVGLLSVLSVWVFGSTQSTLTFTEAEIQFFFPAPATRRALLNYKLLKSMAVGLFTTAFFTVLFGRAVAGSQLFFVVGFWLALSTLSFHTVAAGRTRQALAEHGAVGWKAYAPTLLIVASVGAALAWGLHRLGPLPRFDATRAWVEAVLGLLEAPPLGWVLWPISAFAKVIFAPNAGAFARALPGAAAVMGLHYLWVIAGDVSFEENALRAAERRAKLIEARRSGRGAPMVPAGKRKPPFVLRPQGPAEVALIWKGLIAAGRLFNTRTVVILSLALVPIAVITGAFGGVAVGASILGITLLGFWAMSTLAGGAFSRSDLRRDLEYVDVLRALPLSGRQVVIGEALGALVPAMLVQWGLLALGLVLVQDESFLKLTLEDKVVWGLALALVGPAVTLGAILVQNAAVIFVPGWVANPRTGMQGPEASGVAMLVLLGTLLGVSFGLLPALVFGGLVGFAISPLLGLWSLLPAAVAMTSVALVEAWFAAALLGAAFERSEPGT